MFEINFVNHEILHKIKTGYIQTDEGRGTITYGQLMRSLLIFKCPMSHGTMKYTLKAHVYYFVFMA